jgi:RHS repeat-associated protein
LSAGSTNYTYDNNGNRLTQVVGGTTSKYIYDFENRLTSLSQGASILGNYTYSPLGQRIQKVESGATTTYLNNGVNVLYEKIGTIINDYVFTSKFLLSKLSGGNMYYFHQDVLGGTRLVTIGSTTSFSTNYQPFGQQFGARGTDPNYKYTGKPQDTASGLYYYGARYLDVSTGRFISRDPASQQLSDPQSHCQYSYVRSNPESYLDPSGACITAINFALNVVFLVLGLLGQIWVRFARPDFVIRLATYLIFNFIPRASYQLISGNTGTFLSSTLPQMSIWIATQVLQVVGFWAAISLSAYAFSGTFLINLAASIGFFLYFTLAPLFTPPVGICPDPSTTTTSSSTTYRGGYH